jgi:glycosyltransferase involved in cell wall biosynthesis
MKILLAVHHFLPSFKGGAEWEAFRIAKSLTDCGHKVQVICVESISDKESKPLRWVDDDFKGLKVRRLYMDLSAAPDPRVWEYDNQWIGEQLRSLIKTFEPDVFHLISGYLISGRSIMVAKQMDIPVVVSLMDYWFLCKRISMLRSDGQLSTLPFDAANCARCLGEERRSYRYLGEFLPKLSNIYWQHKNVDIDYVVNRHSFLMNTLNQADILICRSKFIQSMYEEAGINPERMLFSRQGLPLANSAQMISTKTPSSILRIGYLGQIAKLKGVHVLVDAFRLLQDLPLHLSIFGNMDAHPKYSSQLEINSHSDPRIEFSGIYSDSEELDRIYQSLDIVVVPSIWYENSPNVILEAFAHRTPVITSNLGGMAELVDDNKTGLLFKMGDAADLAKKIRTLSNNPELLAGMRKNISSVKTHEEEMDELIGVYKDVCRVCSNSYPSNAL